jgi:hypothetical protein
MTRTLLLLDVDGVLNPSASRRWLDKSDFRKRDTTVANGNTYPVWLNRAHGKMLLDLCADNNMELVWCTTWEDEANDFIGPRLGLPQLPVIKFGWNAMTWKFGAVLDYVQDRSLAWLDDDFQLHHKYRDWFLDLRGNTPTLLQETNPATGLTIDDINAIEEWVKNV